MRFAFEGQSNEYERERLTEWRSGGEGVIYVLDSKALAKIYHDEQLTRHRQEKVLALCSRYNHFAGVFGDARFAWPESPALSSDIQEIVGFRMAHLGSWPTLDQLKYDSDARQYRLHEGKRLDDEKAIALAYSLFDALDRLHTARIVVGDVNPKNVLVDVATATTKIVDIDSCHIEEFPCTVCSPDYLDPMTEAGGKRPDGSLNYSSASDCYAAAAITYLLIIGAFPNFMRSVEGLSRSSLKAMGLSLLAHVEDPKLLASRGVHLRPHANDTLFERLAEVKRLDGEQLYRYWHDVLVNGRRYNLLERLPITDPRNPAHRLLAGKGSRTIVDTIREGQAPHRASLPLEPRFFPDEDVQTIVGLTRRTSRLRSALEGVDPVGFQLFVENLGFDYRGMLEMGT